MLILLVAWSFAQNPSLAQKPPFTQSPQQDVDICSERSQRRGNVLVVTRCEKTGEEYVVDLVVRYVSLDAGGRLDFVSLQFCGRALEAKAPKGWEVDFERSDFEEAEGQMITWTLKKDDKQSQVGPAFGEELKDLRIRFQGEWCLGSSYTLGFDNYSGSGGGTSYSCTDWRRSREARKKEN